MNLVLKVEIETDQKTGAVLAAYFEIRSGQAAEVREDMNPRSFTPEDLFKHSRPAGVDRINLIQMSFYGFDNRYMLDMLALHKDLFVGTAVIDPHAKEPNRRMAELAKQRVRAFRIH